MLGLKRKNLTAHRPRCHFLVDFEDVSNWLFTCYFDFVHVHTHCYLLSLYLAGGQSVLFLSATYDTSGLLSVHYRVCVHLCVLSSAFLASLPHSFSPSSFPFVLSRRFPSRAIRAVLFLVFLCLGLHRLALSCLALLWLAYKSCIVIKRCQRERVCVCVCVRVRVCDLYCVSFSCSFF